MSIYAESREIAERFDRFYDGKGYRVLPPVPITSEIDPTVYLTNSATNLFKGYLGGGECLCARQPSMRTQILRDFYDRETETEYPTCFVSFGAFVPPEKLRKLVDDTVDFHTGIGFLPERMRLRVSARERILTEYARASRLGGKITRDERDHKYDHVYGGGLRGRALKLDYYQESLGRYKNLGYFLTIQRGEEILGAEYASSDQLILMRRRELRYGISASPMADILAADTFEQRRFADCVAGYANLVYEGLMPNSSDTNGRTLKKYIAGISYFGPKLGTPADAVPAIAMDYLALAYGEGVRTDRRLAGALPQALRRVWKDS